MGIFNAAEFLMYSNCEGALFAGGLLDPGRRQLCASSSSFLVAGKNVSEQRLPGRLLLRSQVEQVFSRHAANS